MQEQQAGADGLELGEEGGVLGERQAQFPAFQFHLVAGGEGRVGQGAVGVGHEVLRRDRAVVDFGQGLQESGQDVCRRGVRGAVQRNRILRAASGEVVEIGDLGAGHEGWSAT